MSGICSGRVVVITGAGRGLGRGYAIEFAKQGASVVVNDFGVASDGIDQVSQPAHDVVAEIQEFGGKAVADAGDVSDERQAQDLMDMAVDRFGRVDVVVNNAGILRDRSLANMSFEEWDAVLRVHLRGTFATSRWAANHWRDRFKSGEEVHGRLINTSSSSGIFAAFGQANYAAAKAGIAALTIVASRELARYGVTANAIYPTALSRLTTGLLAEHPGDGSDFDALDAHNVAPVVAWLGSLRSARVNGRVIGVRGGRIVIAEGWVAGPSLDVGRRWDAAELDDVMEDLVSRAAENAATNGLRPAPSSLSQE